jgi:hypothetical protein
MDKLKAQDLRLGNIVNYNGQPTTVWGIISPTPRKEKRFDSKYLLEINAPDSFLVAIDECKPIPLSKDILLRLGFEKLERKDVFENIILPYWVKNSVLLFYNEGEHNKGSYLLGFGEMRAGKYMAATIRWIYDVHTLQNAFALTGTELTTKSN